MVFQEFHDLEVKYTKMEERFDSIYRVHEEEKDNIHQRFQNADQLSQERVQEYETRLGEQASKINSQGKYQNIFK